MSKRKIDSMDKKNKLDKKDYFFLALITLLYLFLTLSSALQNDIYVDEPVHISAGYTRLKLNDFRMDTEDPPVSSDISAVPLMFIDMKDYTEINSWKQKQMVNYSCIWLYNNIHTSKEIIFLGRLPTIFLGLVLGLFIFYYIFKKYDKTTALIVYLLYSTHPMILAHAPTTYVDFMFLFFNFFTFIVLLEFIETKKERFLYLFFILFSLTFLTKFTSVYNFILYPIILLLNYKQVFPWIKTKETLKKLPLYILAFIGIFYVIILVSYSFQNVFVPIEQATLNDPFISKDNPKYIDSMNFFNKNPAIKFISNLPNPFPYYLVKGIGYNLFDARAKESQFKLFDTIKSFLLKNTITITLLLLFYIYLLINSCWKNKNKDVKKNVKLEAKKDANKQINADTKTNTKPNHDLNYLVYILFFILVFGVFGSFIYHRYVLMVYPFVLMLLAKPLFTIINSKMKNIYKITIIGILILIHLISVLSYFPDFYNFNSIFKFIFGPALNDLPFFSTMYAC